MSINSIQTTKSNTCPHGLPVGTCPICNGMMGGGSASKPKADKPKSDEWSWMKCYIQGQMMKAAEAKSEANQAMLNKEINMAAQIGRSITNFVLNMQTVLNNIQNNLPAPLQGVFAKVVNNILTPLLNIISKLPQVVEKIEKFITDIKAQLVAVAEKLTALLGEFKNFIEKKLYNNFKKMTKKLLKLFIWSFDEENPETDEELEIFKSRELRKVKNAILMLQKKGEKDEHTGDKICATKKK